VLEAVDPQGFWGESGGRRNSSLLGQLSRKYENSTRNISASQYKPDENSSLPSISLTKFGSRLQNENFTKPWNSSTKPLLSLNNSIERLQSLSASLTKMEQSVHWTWKNQTLMRNFSYNHSKILNSTISDSEAKHQRAHNFTKLHNITRSSTTILTTNILEQLPPPVLGRSTPTRAKAWSWKERHDGSFQNARVQLKGL